MKKQELFTWEYDKNLKPGCNIQLEKFIRNLLETYIINHQFITIKSTCGSNYILGMNFIVTKL